MDFRRLALDHASKGYAVFPVSKEKIPYRGNMDWENNASLDSSQIHSWWDEHPGALPAIAPGRANLAVIDLDQHPDKPNGFKSLVELKTKIGNPYRGRSISGNGIHLWYLGGIGSANGIYPGIDRKANGGYVVAPYIMIPVSEHTLALPDIFRKGGGDGGNSERVNMSDKELDMWMMTTGDGPISARIQVVVDNFTSNGNEQMSRNLARVVALASSGQTGGFYAINKMLEIWLGGHHSSGDPEREFHASLRSAIERFGTAPSEEDTIYSRWRELTAEMDEGYHPNAPILRLVLDTYLERVCPDWVDRRSAAKVKQTYKRCMEALELVTTQVRETLWLEGSKKAMTNALGVDYV